MYAEAEWLALSGIQHFAFCRRQWALIHIEQAWAENLRTAEGKIIHEKVHEADGEKRGDVIITRAMPVFSRMLGIRGVCDVVEFHKDSSGISIHGRAGKYCPAPVEYKRGKVKEGNADILQLCAQAMCLEEMLVCDILEGSLFYAETKRRLAVTFDAALRQSVKDAFSEMHAYFRRGYTPKARPGRSCKACSLTNLCIPKLGKNKSAVRYMRTSIEEAGE